MKETGQGLTKDVDYLAACGYVEKLFHRQNDQKERGGSGSSKAVYAHVTCAIDRGIVEKVFFDVQSMIIRKSLAAAGLI